MEGDTYSEYLFRTLRLSSDGLWVHGAGVVGPHGFSPRRKFLGLGKLCTSHVLRSHTIECAPGVQAQQACSNSERQYHTCPPYPQAIQHSQNDALHPSRNVESGQIALFRQIFNTVHIYIYTYTHTHIFHPFRPDQFQHGAHPSRKNNDTKPLRN